ncbi:hypothetical protein BDA96_02G063300 [Sorghum bicolor]|uniref:Uncharacterized protein n=2 Tax=Sorghum bicolor TaxID=4558 RepID=A0A921RLR9_SORBI|nr:hypothetical protein BDA96_02G063300 [Sorghum bicolor]KXG34590.1 hypothetical protein SORBI_3002G063000 [Sorghum bicolor]
MEVQRMEEQHRQQQQMAEILRYMQSLGQHTGLAAPPSLFAIPPPPPPPSARGTPPPSAGSNIPGHGTPQSQWGPWGAG